MKRNIVRATMLASMVLAGCSSDASEDATEKTEGAESALVENDALASMLELGTKHVTATAIAKVKPFYATAKTLCHGASAALGATVKYYERGAIYYGRTPYGVRALCVDVAETAGTDSPTFASLSGGVLHGAIAWNLGRFQQTDPAMFKVSYDFERGSIVIGGVANACVEVGVGDQRQACERELQGKLLAGVRAPRTAEDMAALDGFVRDIFTESPVGRTSKEGKLIAFLGYRMDLGPVGSRPSLRNSDITYGFARGYANVNMETGMFTGKNTVTGRTDGGDTGIILADP